MSSPEPRTAAGRALPRPMDWYHRQSDGELLYGYLLSPAEIAVIEAEAAALDVDALARALRAVAKQYPNVKPDLPDLMFDAYAGVLRDAYEKERTG